MIKWTLILSIQWPLYNTTKGNLLRGVFCSNKKCALKVCGLVISCQPSLPPPVRVRQGAKLHKSQKAHFAESPHATTPPQTGVGPIFAEKDWCKLWGSFWIPAPSPQLPWFPLASEFFPKDFLFDLPSFTHSCGGTGGAVLQMRPKPAAVMLCQLRGWVRGAATLL